GCQHHILPTRAAVGEKWTQNVAQRPAVPRPLTRGGGAHRPGRHRREQPLRRRPAAPALHGRLLPRARRGGRAARRVHVLRARGGGRRRARAAPRGGAPGVPVPHVRGGRALCDGRGAGHGRCVPWGEVRRGRPARRDGGVYLCEAVGAEGGAVRAAVHAHRAARAPCGVFWRAYHDPPAGTVSRVSARDAVDAELCVSQPPGAADPEAVAAGEK
ncbi:hypothetical protein C8J57DRAFT_1707993, partial [Mycena rebaudengoi]